MKSVSQAYGEPKPYHRTVEPHRHNAEPQNS